MIWKKLSKKMFGNPPPPASSLCPHTTMSPMSNVNDDRSTCKSKLIEFSTECDLEQSDLEQSETPILQSYPSSTYILANTSTISSSPHKPSTKSSTSSRSSKTYHLTTEKWLSDIHNCLLYTIYILAIMFLLLALLWLLLRLSSGLPSMSVESPQSIDFRPSYTITEQPPPMMPVTSPAMLSLEVYKNGTVLVDNVTNNGDGGDDVSKKNEKERIMVRERIKQNHLSYIRNQLANILLAGRPPPPSNVTASTLSDSMDDVMKIKEVVENGVWPTITPSPAKTPSRLPGIDTLDGGGGAGGSYTSEEIYAQRLQSFFPSCDTTILDFLRSRKSVSAKNNDDPASNVDEPETEMNLYFDLTIPKSLDTRRHVTVMWAKLRLHMFDGPGCDVEAVQSMDNSCNDSSTNLDHMSACESNKIIVSLYQYVPPKRKNRLANVRLVDSHTLPYNYRGRLVFNVLSSINDWQKAKMPNYGLVVKIEDRFNRKLSPTKFIRQMNCSDRVLPVPNLAEIYGKSTAARINHDNHNNNTTQDGSSSTRIQTTTITPINKSLRSQYPTLDLMTMESARDDRMPSSTIQTAHQ